MKKTLKLIIYVTFFLMISYVSLAKENSKEISVIAKQFEFLPRQIEVERDQAVKIYITSLDVTHGFTIDVFGINQKVEKGKLTTVEFTPDRAGEFEIRCSVFCGVGHARMKGKLIVTGYRDITATELKTALKEKKFFLLDVHIPEQKHIEGTDAFIPYNEIEKYIDKLPKNKDTKIVVYCRTGPMSTIASKTLLRLGYKNVYKLVGGIEAWEEEVKER